MLDIYLSILLSILILPLVNCRETLIKLLIYCLSSQERDDFADMSYLWDILENAKINKYGKLQEYLQLYFPQWQNNLILNEAKFREEIYIFMNYEL